MTPVSLEIEYCEGYEEVGCRPLQYARNGDAGFDLYSVSLISVPPRERRLIPTGVRMAIPYGFEIQLRPRSGLAYKSGITVLNSPGTIDHGYRGEIHALLYNASDEPYKVRPGDRIAQAILAPVYKAVFETVDCIDEDTDRGTGGFGHTGR